MGTEWNVWIDIDECESEELFNEFLGRLLDDDTGGKITTIKELRALEGYDFGYNMEIKDGRVGWSCHASYSYSDWIGKYKVWDWCKSVGIKGRVSTYIVEPQEVSCLEFGETRSEEVAAV